MTIPDVPNSWQMLQREREEFRQHMLAVSIGFAQTGDVSSAEPRGDMSASSVTRQPGVGHVCRYGHHFTDVTGTWLFGGGPYCTACLRACIDVVAGNRTKEPPLTVPELEVHLHTLIADAKRIRDEIADILVRLDMAQDAL